MPPCPRVQPSQQRRSCRSRRGRPGAAGMWAQRGQQRLGHHPTCRPCQAAPLAAAWQGGHRPVAHIHQHQCEGGPAAQPLLAQAPGASGCTADRRSRSNGSCAGGRGGRLSSRCQQCVAGMPLVARSAGGGTLWRCALHRWGSPRVLIVTHMMQKLSFAAGQRQTVWPGWCSGAWSPPGSLRPFCAWVNR